MKPLADLVAEMLVASVPHSIIVDTIRMRDASVTRDVTDGCGANKSALRSKRYRDKKRLNPSVTESVTRHAKREVSPHTPLPEKVIPPENPSGFLPPKRQPRGTRLPEGWIPERSAANEAEERNFAKPELRIQLLKFRDYWAAKPGAGAVKLDWNATWRNWLRNSKGKPNGNGSQHGNSGKGSGIDFLAQLAGYESVLHQRPVSGCSVADGPIIDGTAVVVGAESDQLFGSGAPREVTK